MIKLVHVISDTNIGGAGKYLIAYLEGCNRNLFDVSVVLPKNSKLEVLVKETGARIYTVSGLGEKSFSWSAVFQLKKLFKSIKPDIVHCHAALSARIGARLAGARYIVYTRHSVFKPEEALTKGLGRMLNRWLNNWAADGIIAVADAARQNLLDTGVADEKIKVIYNGVKPLNCISQEEKQSARESLSIRDGTPVMAIIARLEEVKGHKYFIEAARIVRDMGIDAQFVIAGTGSCSDELKTLTAEKNLEGTVVFPGFVKDIQGLMNVLDIQVNASYGTEAASLSLLEGMSIGKPAVVSDFGGNPELIEDGVNGFVVPQHSAKDLAMAIVQLIRDSAKREQMGTKAKEVFDSRFTQTHMVKQMEEFYLLLCNNLR